MLLGEALIIGWVLIQWSNSILNLTMHISKVGIVCCFSQFLPLHAAIGQMCSVRKVSTIWTSLSNSLLHSSQSYFLHFSYLQLSVSPRMPLRKDNPTWLFILLNWVGIWNWCILLIFALWRGQTTHQTNEQIPAFRHMWAILGATYLRCFVPPYLFPALPA